MLPGTPRGSRRISLLLSSPVVSRPLPHGTIGQQCHNLPPSAQLGTSRLSEESPSLNYRPGSHANGWGEADESGLDGTLASFAASRNLRIYARSSHTMGPLRASDTRHV